MNTDDVTVSPDEMNALMETIKETSDTRTRDVGPDGRVQDVVRYDLVASRTVGGGQLPTLDLVHERFAGLMSEMLRELTGKDATVTAIAATPVKFIECQANLPEVGGLQVIDLEGLRGTGILCFDASLLFQFVDLMLGGTPNGTVNAAEVLKKRGLTNVERRLFGHLTRQLGLAMTAAWAGVSHMAISPVRAEIEPKHVALFEHAEIVVDACFEIKAEGCEGMMHIILPQSALRPIEKKLASGLLDNGDEGAESWTDPLTEIMHEIPALTTAELGRCVMTLRELLSLQVGQVVRLDREPNNPITVFVEGTPKLMGNPTVWHGNIAVEITSRVTDDEAEGMSEGTPSAMANETGFVVNPTEKGVDDE